MRVGISLAPATPVEAILAYLEDVDDVVVLAVEPGWAGQPFQLETLPKIEALRSGDRSARSWTSSCTSTAA